MNIKNNDHCPWLIPAYQPTSRTPFFFILGIYTLNPKKRRKNKNAVRPQREAGGDQRARNKRDKSVIFSVHFEQYFR
jgi:hypothetical protein